MAAARDWKDPLRRTPAGDVAFAARTLVVDDWIGHEVLSLFAEARGYQADWVTDHVFMLGVVNCGAAFHGAGRDVVERLVAAGLLEWGRWGRPGFCGFGGVGCARTGPA